MKFISRQFRNLRVVIKHELLAPLIRVYFYSKLRDYTKATNTLDSIITILEEYRVKYKEVLLDLYSFLFKLYIISGYMEDAALTVIRANEKLRVNHLPNNSDFDVKVAHIVKASIAAVRMLEDDTASATLIISNEHTKPRLVNQQDIETPPPCLSSPTVIRFPIQ